MAPGVIVDDGLLLGLRSDSVLVADADARFSVGLGEIEALSVEGSLWRSLGLQCDQHAGRVALRWGLVFGTGGTLAGVTVGSRLHRWRQVFP